MIKDRRQQKDPQQERPNTSNSWVHSENDDDQRMHENSTGTEVEVQLSFLEDDPLYILLSKKHHTQRNKKTRSTETQTETTAEYQKPPGNYLEIYMDRLSSDMKKDPKVLSNRNLTYEQYLEYYEKSHQKNLEYLTPPPSSGNIPDMRISMTNPVSSCSLHSPTPCHPPGFPSSQSRFDIDCFNSCIPFPLYDPSLAAAFGFPYMPYYIPPPVQQISGLNHPVTTFPQPHPHPHSHSIAPVNRNNRQPNHLVQPS
jgi:hypothetical protein